MVINMRYLLILFFILFLHSDFLFAQDPPPEPICPTRILAGCDLMSIVSTGYASCLSQPQSYFSVGSECGTAYGEPKYTYTCDRGCTCPPGSTWNQAYNIQSQQMESGCVPDTPPSEGGDECEPPQVMYAGLCRDGEDSPGDCGGTYDTAIFVDGRYVCASGGCESAAGTSVYTNANGSWSVCGSGDDGEPPSSSPSSNPSNPSSEPSNGGSGSSSGGSGGGDDDGDGTGAGGGSGNGTGNGTGNGSGNSSGGQTSSVSGGGGGNPPTQNSSANSSGSGWASSGSGAGNCDPTAHDYLDCISRENPGEGGDGLGDINQEAYELDIQQRLQQARDKYTDKVQQIKDDLSEELSVNIGSGSGSLPSNKVNMYGETIELGIAARKDFFDLIKWVFLAAASVLSLYIVLGK